MQVVELTKHKGGQGATVTAATFALVALDRAAPTNSVLIVTDSLDMFAALGLANPTDDRGGITSTGGDRLHVVHVEGKVTRTQLEGLAEGLGSRYVVTDLSRPVRDVKNSRPLSRSKDIAHEGVTVCRPCYMAARATVAAGPVDHLITFQEEGRALNARDIRTVLRPETFTEAIWDTTISRSIDAGLIMHRRPKALEPIEAAAREVWEGLTIHAAALAAGQPVTW